MLLGCSDMLKTLLAQAHFCLSRLIHLTGWKAYAQLVSARCPLCKRSLRQTEWNERGKEHEFTRRRAWQTAEPGYHMLPRRKKPSAGENVQRISDRKRRKKWHSRMGGDLDDVGCFLTGRLSFRAGLGVLVLLSQYP